MRAPPLPPTGAGVVGACRCPLLLCECAPLLPACLRALTCAPPPSLHMPARASPPATRQWGSFGIKNDFTPEEEALVKDENRWCVGGPPP